MIRIVSSFSACTSMSKRPASACPTRRNRASVSEWSGSFRGDFRSVHDANNHVTNGFAGFYVSDGASGGL
jgi:hypothetical protein